MRVKNCKSQQARIVRGIPQSSFAKRAFTLAEVMVAVCILGVSCIALYGGLATGFVVIDSTRGELRATQILTQKSEALRLCSWSSLANLPISFTETYDPAATNSGTVYVGTVSTNVPAMIPVLAAYRTNMCIATITLYWTNYNGTQKIVHSRTNQTLIARYGIQNYIWGNAQ